MFQVGDYVTYRKHLRGSVRNIGFGIIIEDIKMNEDERAELIALFGPYENDSGFYAVKWLHDKCTTDTDGSLLRKVAFKKFQKSS